MTQGLATSSTTSCRVRWRICCRKSLSIHEKTAGAQGVSSHVVGGRQNVASFFPAAPTSLRSRLFFLFSQLAPEPICANCFACPDMRSAKAVVSEKLARLGASSMSYHGGAHVANRPPHTITSLRRWSIVNKELPGETRPGPRMYYCNSADKSYAISCFPNSRDSRV